MPAARIAAALIVFFLAGSPAWTKAKLEYVAHAAFVIHSPIGTRVVIDPYNSSRWLGYSFPEGISADAVLITHPHYDHDAAYSVAGHPAVFRHPGRYQVGDVRISGIAGKHADPYGEDFGQINTIWVVETGRVRIAHLGDNGPLSEQQAGLLGAVDVLLMPVDGQYHILKKEEAEQVLERVKPRIAVPMHYRIPSLSPLPESLGPVDPWLEGRDGVERLSGNVLQLSSSDASDSPRVVVFEPSPAVQPWPPAFQKAMGKLLQARGLAAQDPARALQLLEEATGEAPQAIIAWWGRGQLLAAAGRTEDAVRVLEQGLSLAGLDDAEYTLRARVLLARLYRQSGRADLARLQYRLVRQGAFREELRSEAEAFLQKTP